MQLNISVRLSDNLITTYRNEYFNPNFQEEDVNHQILESVNLQKKIASDIVNSIRKERPDELFKLLDPIYNAVEDFDNSGFIQLSITNKDDVYEEILTELENGIVTDLKMNEEFRKEISKEIIDAIHNLEHI